MLLTLLRRTIRDLREQARQARERQRQRQRRRDFAKLSTRDIFTQIYSQRLWGGAPSISQPFFSGIGSLDPQLVGAYVAAVRGVLAEFPSKPDVVDLGCGDFRVGAQIRDLCGGYVACDIVAPLIEDNRRRYAHTDTDFRVLDVTREALPAGEIAFVRQVLQHLSNAEVAAAVSQLAATYRYLIITEHLPNGSYVPNLDKPTGNDIRLHYAGSGIDVTLPPFNLQALEVRCLCEGPQLGGVVKTCLYRLS